MRYQVYERGLLKSARGATERKPLMQSDNLTESVEALWELYEWNLAGFVLDTKTNKATEALYEPDDGESFDWFEL